MVVGLTGGIGSGKTTVLKMFHALGAETYIADVEAKKIMNTSAEVKQQIAKLFGVKSYLDGTLNRAYIAEIVFKNPEKLQALNAIVHPAVRKDFNVFVENSKSAYVVYESAILFESDNFQFCDVIVVVVAPLDLRIERVLQRETTSKAQIEARIKNQLPDEVKIAKADFVLENTTLDKLQADVLELHQQFLKLT
ncbi:dephospho-CoA kinase [Flavicella sediminum]|uniref:dephospho-CoA kinase n=1 Tax=Flavicella sediminum TaxID=2585141 RepID=UPI0011230078|nr:dephospho-CoA kinase [Flavicella sediminum]